MSTERLLHGWSPHHQPLAEALHAILHGSDGKELLDVLETFQNDDGGFGHGLEADIQMPTSNVASTNLAFHLLHHVTHSDKNQMIQRAIKYYESVFDETKLAFEIVPKEVDDHPHAIWWNYDGIESFTYGNPNPEIAGTLLQSRQYVSSIDVDAFVHQVVAYINHEMDETLSMHSLLSSLWLYARAPFEIRDAIRPALQKYLHRLLATDVADWKAYGLEPYKVFLIVPEFLDAYPTALHNNIVYVEEQLSQGPMTPNWNWHQFEDVFTEVKDQWSILMTFDALNAIRTYRKQ